jgi:hypothetical protein
MSQPLMIQEVPYLAASRRHRSQDGQERIVLTIRPDPGSYRPHNVGLTVNEARRLLRDLRRLLAATSLLLLLSLAPGCSGRVEVFQEQESAVERTSTVVAVDLSAGDQQPLPPSPGRGVQITGDGNVAVVIEGDVYLSEPPKSARKKSLPAWNTRIGLPPLQAGKWMLSCHVVVCVLVAAAVMLMVENLHRQQGPLLLILVMLVAAAVLLQFLPPTEFGVQFLPLSPWAYSGWWSFGVSVMVWGTILGAGYVALDQCLLDRSQVFAWTVLVAMGLNVLLSFV